MEFYAYHGCFAEEQIIGTRFLVDLYLDTDTKKAELSDELKDTVNYQEVLVFSLAINATSIVFVLVLRFIELKVRVRTISFRYIGYLRCIKKRALVAIKALKFQMSNLIVAVGYNQIKLIHNAI